MPLTIRSVLPSVVQRSVQYALSRSSFYSKESRIDQLDPSIPPSNVNQTNSSSDSDDVTSTPSSGASAPALVAVGNSPHSIAIPPHFHVPANSQHITRDENECGVDWVIAGVGIQLWLHARARAETTPDSALLRSMHLDALRYMNLALPTDLSSTEIAMLQSCLPEQLIQQQGSVGNVVVAANSNILRRTIAQMVYWTIVAVLLIIPLLATISKRLLEYEREHHIARRMIHSGTDAIKAVGERTLDLGDAIVQCKDTNLGKASLNMSAWVLESVAGGLNDGLSRGVGSKVKLLEP